MKPLIYCVVGIVVVAGVLRADPPKTSNAVDSGTRLAPLMLKKLDKSKGILEGLTLEDFDKIKSNANTLRLLSLESGWNVIQTEEYQAQSLEFRRAAELIAQAAEEKDIHRAMIGYVSLTVRCVECHSYMRKHRVELIQAKP